jgi:site-specific DNA-methyltransferase (adenine-specific)
MSNYEIILGDSVEKLKNIDDNSIDSIVTDPPAAINFMNKAFDTDFGDFNKWVDWLSEIMVECKRVLKPGAHLLCWSLPRTNFLTGMAIHQAGFEVRDVITHLFGSGFPKSLNLSKSIDKMKGAIKKESNLFTEPITEEAKYWAGWGSALKPSSEFWYLARKPFKGSIAGNVLEYGVGGINIDESRVKTEEELGRNNVNIKNSPLNPKDGWNSNNMKGLNTVGQNKKGRWPANLILSHSVDCVKIGEKKVKVEGMAAGTKKEYDKKEKGFFAKINQTRGDGFKDKNGLETITDYQCTDDCPVKILGEQSGELKNGGKLNAKRLVKSTENQHVYGKYNDIEQTEVYGGDKGTAARFFNQFEPEYNESFYYTAKASVSERNEGLEGMDKKQQSADGKIRTYNDRCSFCKKKFVGDVGYRCECTFEERMTDKTQYTNENNHPTIKSLSLMRWLCKLITPPEGTVLDPFMGSGSTGIAALQLDFNFIGIEKEKDYFEIARKRLEHCKEPYGQMTLF